MPENQKWGSKLSLVSQRFNKWLIICAAFKINHFQAQLHWPNLQSWAVVSATQPRTALRAHLLCWGSDAVRILPILSAKPEQWMNPAKQCQNARSVKWCLLDFELWGLLDLPHLLDITPNSHSSSHPVLTPSYHLLEFFPHYESFQISTPR